MAEGAQFSYRSGGQGDIDLFLTGKTGNGKSSTGNSILRKHKRFKTTSSMSSVTNDIDFDFTIFNGRTIKVVDGLGVGDTRMSTEDGLREVQNQLQMAITANPDGYHAFLLVLRYGSRFTEEDFQTIYSLKQIFGEDFVKNFCIILFTCGDSFKYDQEDTDWLSFDQWLKLQGGRFKKLLQECEGRAVLFDNTTKDDTVMNDQVTQLISVVDSLGGKRYTDENFEKARSLREKQMIESIEPRVREETLKETTILIQILRDIKKKELENQVPDLTSLMIRASKLYQSVQNQDKKTDVLKEYSEAAHSIHDLVKAHLEHCKKMTFDRQKEMKMHHHFYLSARQLPEETLQTNTEKHKNESLHQQEPLENLRQAMKNKTEQMQRDFEKKFQLQVEEAEKRRRKEQEEFERKIQIQIEEGEKKLKRAEQKFTEQLQRERKGSPQIEIPEKRVRGNMFAKKTQNTHL